MKKSIITGMAVLLGLIMTVSVYAMGPGGWYGAGSTAVANLNIESVKNFLKDTSAVRNELIIKRIELMKAYEQKEVNYDETAKIQKEIIDLKTKVLDSARKYGLDKEVGRWFKMRYGMMGKGMGPGMRSMQPGMMGCPCSTPK
ncbi:MAG: hypothetical protein M1381_08910 [Deltaproteobacteria bacterium]|nr:hypothetical protein [Deltaproteobacteria bacterium]